MRFASLIERFRKEPDIYLTLLVAAVAFFLHVFHLVEERIVNGIVLMVLGLVSFSSLQIRQKLEGARSSIDHLSSLLEDLRKQLPSKTKEIEQVSESQQRVEQIRTLVHEAKKEVFLLGTTWRHVSVDPDLLKKAIREGKLIRLLILDPDYLESNPEYAKQVEANLGVDDIYRETKNSLDRFCKIMQEVAQEAKNETLAITNFQIRVYSVTPTIGLVVSDPKKEGSRMVLELFLYNCSVYNRPRFWIKPAINQDNVLYDRVLTQAEQLWSNAKPITFNLDKEIKDKLAANNLLTPNAPEAGQRAL